MEVSKVSNEHGFHWLRLLTYLEYSIDANGHNWNSMTVIKYIFFVSFKLFAQFVIGLHVGTCNWLQIVSRFSLAWRFLTELLNVGSL